jgi:aspartyl/asparaginyl beta-hydroxylase (cupin superfamily)
MPQPIKLHKKSLLRVAQNLRHATDWLYWRYLRGPQRPVFFDPARTFPALLEIDRNFDAIKAELVPVLDRIERMPRYHEIDRSQQVISGNDERDWRVICLSNPLAPEAWRPDKQPNEDLFPRTVEIVRGIPDVIQAFFSILEPGKSVPAHTGPTPSYLRYHTAFKVPRHKPPTLRVKDRFHTWEEGKSLLFDDSWEHEVFNESEEPRVVLIVDVLRPVPWPLRALNALTFWFKRVGTTRERWEMAVKRRELDLADVDSSPTPAATESVGN